MEYINGLTGFIAGFAFFPIFMFIRARKAMPTMDKSNLMNAFRIVNLVIHPKRFTELYWKDGRKAYPWLEMDEDKGIMKDYQPPK